MKVELREVERCIAYFRRINEAELPMIEWYLDGVRVEPPEGAVDEFKFCGLANRTFAEQMLTQRFE